MAVGCITRPDDRRGVRPRVFSPFPERCQVKLRAVVHEAEEGGYWAEVPALPGCASQGETFADLHSNLREAIEAILSAESPPHGVAVVLEPVA